MAKRFLKKKVKFGGLILTVLILPAFIFWGSEVILRSIKTNPYIGVVFDKKVSLDEFKESLEAVKNRFLLQAEEELIKNTDLLEAQAWDRIILLREAKRKKIKVDDEEVKSFIQNHPFFWQNKKFDLSLYQYLCRSLFKMLPRQFEEKIREDLMISKLYDEITSDINLSEEDIRISYLRKNEKIAVEYLSKNFKDIEETLKPQDEELLNYYKSHLQEFKIPPTFNLQYVATDDVVKAETFYRKIKKYKDFLKVASVMGLDVKETGFFSTEEPIPGIGWNMVLVYIVENLNLGQFSSPLKVGERYFIIRLKEKKSSYIANFQDIKEKLKNTFIKNEAKRITRELMENVFSKIEKNGIDFAKASKEFNLNYGTTDLFSRETYIPQIGSSDKFFLALPELSVGTLSKGIIEMEQAIFIIKVKEYVGIDEDVYQKEKEKFAKELSLKLKNARFLEFLLSLRNKAKIYKTYF